MDAALIALGLSLKVALWATAIDLVLGVALGYLLARGRFMGRDVLDALLTLPMVMPPTVLGYYLLVVIGRHIENGKHGIDYVGTQFVLAFLVVSVPDTYEALHLSVGVERVAGVLLGIVLLEPVRMLLPVRRVFTVESDGRRSDDSSE